jgi:hypothetical protein
MFRDDQWTCFTVEVNIYLLWAYKCKSFLVDLFAITVGLCIISTIIAATRYSYACMTSGATRFLALEMHLLFFIWVSNLFELPSFIFVYFMLVLSNLKLLFPDLHHSSIDRLAG